MENRLLEVIMNESSCWIDDNLYLFDVVEYNNKIRVQIFINDDGKLKLYYYAPHVDDDGEITINYKNKKSNKLRINEFLDDKHIKMILEFYNFDPNIKNIKKEKKNIEKEIRKKMRKDAEEWFKGIKIGDEVSGCRLVYCLKNKDEYKDFYHLCWHINDYMIAKWRKKGLITQSKYGTKIGELK